VIRPVGSPAAPVDRALFLRSWPVMNPTGTMPYLFAAFSSRFAGSFLGGIVLEGDALEPGECVPNVGFIVDRQASPAR